MLIAGTIAFARKPRGAGGKRGSATQERARLVETRETLFAELVQLERTARAAGTPAPAAQREQLVGKLEQVYLAIAELDEPRAA